MLFFLFIQTQSKWTQAAQTPGQTPGQAPGQAPGSIELVAMSTIVCKQQHKCEVIIVAPLRTILKYTWKNTILM